ncbi:hypothetical protein CC2G_014473 [Coprinopsis cinerea AmutBmut pab1-1]|nr:hypothetical protein CC2G_014473 [Coprinopsis cinerea AmutBmut pab1-1]
MTYLLRSLDSPFSYNEAFSLSIDLGPPDTLPHFPPKPSSIPSVVREPLYCAGFFVDSVYLHRHLPWKPLTRQIRARPVVFPRPALFLRPPTRPCGDDDDDPRRSTASEDPKTIDTTNDGRNGTGRGRLRSANPRLDTLFIFCSSSYPSEAILVSYDLSPTVFDDSTNRLPRLATPRSLDPRIDGSPPESQRLAIVEAGFQLEGGVAKLAGERHNRATIEPNEPTHTAALKPSLRIYQVSYPPGSTTLRIHPRPQNSLCHTGTYGPSLIFFVHQHSSIEKVWKFLTHRDRILDLFCDILRLGGREEAFVRRNVRWWRYSLEEREFGPDYDSSKSIPNCEYDQAFPLSVELGPPDVPPQLPVKPSSIPAAVAGLIKQGK